MRKPCAKNSIHAYSWAKFATKFERDLAKAARRSHLSELCPSQHNHDRVQDSVNISIAFTSAACRDVSCLGRDHDTLPDVVQTQISLMLRPRTYVRFVPTKNGERPLKSGGGGAFKFFQVGVCGPDSRSVFIPTRLFKLERKKSQVLCRYLINTLVIFSREIQWDTLFYPRTSFFTESPVIYLSPKDPLFCVETLIKCMSTYPGALTYHYLRILTPHFSGVLSYKDLILKPVILIIYHPKTPLFCVKTPQIFIYMSPKNPFSLKTPPFSSPKDHSFFKLTLSPKDPYILNAWFTCTSLYINRVPPGYLHPSTSYLALSFFPNT